jgi:hypothetical protein
MAHVVTLNAFWQQTLSPALAATGKCGATALCAHSRAEAVLTFSRSLRWLVSSFHKTSRRVRAI